MNEEISLFSFSTPRFRIDKPVRLIELFAGIGAQAKALERLGIPFEHWYVCEIDRFAMASYNAVHGTNFETKDITKLHADELQIRERERYCYIMTYSFPCQDLSLAGKQSGMSKESGTRSGLLWEVERLLDECGENLPQVLLLENVPQVIGKKNIADFQLWRKKLESLGYSNFVEVLNSKNYGIPQNRNRCYMVSLLGDWHYTFPKPVKLELRLKDLLEDEVDEKYYVSEKAVKYIMDEERMKAHYTDIDPDYAITVTAKGQNNWTGSFVSDGGGSQKQSVKAAEEALTGTRGISFTTNKVGYLEYGTGEHQSNRIHSTGGVARTIDTTFPMIIYDDVRKK